ncbi:unnamed protein product [Dovyalis caffra]|uniref:Uncharacterized protein n=1 Tax=Dovyalis caffra TaxID=77055 RepID=A0AAV1SHV1_9ROSI|nr:unnamed protein product [Dovyalis caffra]
MTMGFLLKRENMKNESARNKKFGRAALYVLVFGGRRSVALFLAERVCERPKDEGNETLEKMTLWEKKRGQRVVGGCCGEWSVEW